MEASERGVAGVRAVERTLAILEAFTFSKREPNLSDISSTVNLPKSTTHRLLQTLVASGLVDRGHRRGTYRLSLRLANLGAVALWDRRPSQEMLEILRSLRDEWGESVGLSMLHGRDAIVVSRAHSWRALSANIQVGSILPGHASGAGKVFLAHVDEAEFSRLFPEAKQLTRFNHRTITSVGDLRAAVRLAARQGYAIDDGECDNGLRCVAVPVYDSAATCRYALGLSASSANLGQDDLMAVADGLKKAATAMTPFVDVIGPTGRATGEYFWAASVYDDSFEPRHDQNGTGAL